MRQRKAGGVKTRRTAKIASGVSLAALVITVSLFAVPSRAQPASEPFVLLVQHDDTEADPADVVSGFTVQVGAFREPGGADLLLAHIRARFGDGAVLREQVRDQTLYRVTSGFFLTKEEARAHAIELERLGFSTYVREVRRARVRREKPRAVRAAPTQVQPSAPVLQAPPGSPVAEPAGPPAPQAKPGTPAAAPGPVPTVLEPPADPLEITRRFGARAAEDRAVELATRPDEKRPAEQLTINLLGRPLTIGGEIELQPRYRKDFAFESKDDDDAKLDTGFELEGLWRLRENLAVFLEAQTEGEVDLYREAGGEDADFELRRGQTWLYWSAINGSGWEAQVGRMNFADKREWWWDADLDAIRLGYRRPNWLVEAAVARELGSRSTDLDDVELEDDDVLRALGRARWDWAKDNRIELFFLHHNDESSTPAVGTVLDRNKDDESDAELTWIGARALGKWNVVSKHKLYYWIDLAYVTGKETSLEFDDGPMPHSIVVEKRSTRHVRGVGIDLGATWRIKRWWEPRLTFGYAWGSGDRSETGTDNNFRQTGLQGNNGKFRGVDRFRYYGEVLRPELSNLHVFTFSLGFPLLENSSIELVSHYYLQDEPADFLRDSSLRTDPAGDSDDLGAEIDLILGLEEWEHLELELTSGVFFAGDGFGPLQGEEASLVIFKMKWNF